MNARRKISFYLSVLLLSVRGISAGNIVYATDCSYWRKLVLTSGGTATGTNKTESFQGENGVYRKLARKLVSYFVKGKSFKVGQAIQTMYFIRKIRRTKIFLMLIQGQMPLVLTFQKGLMKLSY